MANSSKPQNKAPGATVKVRKNQVRGVTFLPHGQRYHGWVPAGAYVVECECQLAVGMGSAEMAAALKIGNDKEGTWYIAPSAI